MSEGEAFVETDCDHCGETIANPTDLHELGDNTVHSWCLSEFVDQTPKREITPETCDDCGRSFWTEDGLDRHRGRIHAG